MKSITLRRAGWFDHFCDIVMTACRNNVSLCFAAAGTDTLLFAGLGTRGFNSIYPFTPLMREFIRICVCISIIAVFAFVQSIALFRTGWSYNHRVVVMRCHICIIIFIRISAVFTGVQCIARCCTGGSDHFFNIYMRDVFTFRV